MLQCVAVCGRVVQCVAFYRRFLGYETASENCVAVCYSVLQCVAVCCSVLQCVAVCCSVLQCVAVWYSVLHFVVHFWAMKQSMSTVLQFAAACWMCCSVL